MDRITYQEMIERYGKKMANALLAVVEKNAGITGEVRLQRALDAMDKAQFQKELGASKQAQYFHA